MLLKHNTHTNSSFDNQLGGNKLVGNKVTEELGLNRPWGWLIEYLRRSCGPPSGGLLSKRAAFGLLLDKTSFMGYKYGRATSRGDSRGDRSISVGGACRMVKCEDGVLAVNLARIEDFEMLPAWLEEKMPEPAGEQAWQVLIQHCSKRKARELADRAAELGLAVSLAEKGLTLAPFMEDRPLLEDEADPLEPAQLPAFKDRPVLKVVDLSSLWAGPLAGKLLAKFLAPNLALNSASNSAANSESAGVQVLKVEFANRPDGLKTGGLKTGGLKTGGPDFYEYLNGEKTHLSLAPTAESKTELDQLKQLLSQAHVVIDSSRPRAMENFGIDPKEFVENHGVIWASITGYGRASNRVAFGDDAAVAAGLFLESPFPARLGSKRRGMERRGMPEFIGDAIADPLTGVETFLQIMHHLKTNQPALLDISMVQVVESLLAQ